MGERLIHSIPDYTGVGIYSLRDDRGRVYIGSAKNVRERVMSHNRLMRYGKENQAINAAIASGFTFTASVVERLPPSTNTYQLREAERRYIDLATRHGETYNHDDVSTRHKHQHTGSTRERLSRPLRPDLLEHVEEPEE